MQDAPSGTHTASYVYRFGSRLAQFYSTFPDEPSLMYFNTDGFGRLRGKYVNSKQTWYRADAAGSLIAEYDDPNTDYVIENQIRSYVPGLADVNTATGDYRYLYTDLAGSVRRIRGQNKASLAQYEYSPYGDAIMLSGLPLKTGYTGHLWIPELGMYFTPARIYSPSHARWNSREPSGLDGPNLYRYGRNNPVSYGDPTGLWAVSFFIDFSGGWFGGYGSGQFGVNFDSRGGFSVTGQSGFGGGLQGVTGAGGITFGAAIFPKAPSVQDLEGLGTAIGGSLGGGLGAQHEWLTSGQYSGWGASIGFVKGGEIHAAGTYTKCWWGDCKPVDCP